MIEAAAVFSLVIGAIGTLCTGIARIRLAEAWKIWAERCDPMNPHFQPPSVEKKREER